MKTAYWGYWLILLGVFIVIIMLLIQNLTNSNTITDSMLQEIAEAAMIDAVDYGYYTTYGEVKIIKEKFMEVFVRRMSDTVSGSTTYKIEFLEIYESPPMVSVKVSSSSQTFNIMGDTETFDIIDSIDSILEGNSIENQ